MIYREYSFTELTEFLPPNTRQEWLCSPLSDENYYCLQTKMSLKEWDEAIEMEGSQVKQVMFKELGAIPNIADARIRALIGAIGSDQLYFQSWFESLPLLVYCPEKLLSWLSETSISKSDAYFYGKTTTEPPPRYVFDKSSICELRTWLHSWIDLQLIAKPNDLK